MHIPLDLSSIRRVLLCGEKTDLWMYTDYLDLNQVTVKYCYPLGLVPAALEQLREARIFTKLKHWRAYNLVGIQEGD